MEKVHNTPLSPNTGLRQCFENKENMTSNDQDWLSVKKQDLDDLRNKYKLKYQRLKQVSKLVWSENIEIAT